MKKLSILLGFYRKNWLSALVLIFILTFALLQITSILGTLGYMNYTKDFLLRSCLENSYYYMPMTFEESPRSGAAKSELEAQNFSGIEAVVCPQTGTARMMGKYINVVLCDEAFISTFNPVDSGKWLDQPQAEEFEAVTSGYVFDGIPVGETITVDFGWERSVPVVFSVIGKKNEPSFLPSFGAQSGKITSMDLFTQGHNTILVRENTELQALLGGENLYHGNCIVLLKDEATQEERAEIEAYLQSQGTYIPFSQILANSDESIRQEMKRNLPRPIFLMVVSLASLLSVSVLMIMKMLPEHSVYRLCGCSRIESFGLLLIGIGLIGFGGGVIPCTYILIYPWLTSLEMIDPGATVIDSRLLPVIGCFMLLCILIPVLIAWQQIRKLSPVSLYRREQT